MEDELQGSLIVLAHPGDRVLIDGQEAAVDDTGVARLIHEEGLVNIEVYSGGQQQKLRAALVPNHTVWVRAGDPDPTAVFFRLNSDEISKSAQADIKNVATYAANWSFVLQGGYSPEGGLERNRQLAIDRARAVSRALQAVGISEDRIVFLDPPPPDPNRPAEEQRNCQIIPVAPGGAG
jgi:outer membrane protein OmpA-like peptidoglycan-associated protein